MTHPYNWTQLSPVHVPTGRAGHNMAYDHLRGNIVLFGGLHGSTYLGDTWIWDGSDWLQQSPASSPSARRDFCLAWDGNSGRVILHGGYNRTDDVVNLNDTWAWDGSNWTQLTPVTSPGARTGHTASWNPAAGYLLMFGGANHPAAVYVYLNDTWAWNGANWVNLAPATTPPRRWRHGLAFNETFSVNWMFGGFNGAFLGDFWQWDGSDWTNVFPIGSPSARAPTYQMADWRAGTLLFGGDGGAGLLADSWFLGFFNSAQLTPTNSPPVTTQGAFARYVAENYGLLFGGENTAGGVGNSNTWKLTLPTLSYEVALGYGGVEPQGGGDRTDPSYLQSALPRLDLTPGCTIKLRSQAADDSLRTLDAWSGATLWVDDGS